LPQATTRLEPALATTALEETVFVPADFAPADPDRPPSRQE
jgi:hypothetical protein